MWKAILAGVCCVGAVGLVLGCGSGEGEATSVPLTKAQFIKKAQAICDQVRNEAQDAAATREKAEGKPLDIDVAFKKVVGPSLQREAAKLGALSAPEEDKAELAHMIENLAMGAAAYATGRASVQSISHIESFKNEAKAYGLQACLF